MRTTRILVALVFAVVLSCASTPGQDQSSTGDPVADAARKAREQKKVAPKPKKVFTDDDIAPKPAESAAPAAVDATALEKPQTSPKASSENGNPNSEKAWRKRFTEQRKKISDAELELDVLQREAQKADVQYYSDPQKAMKEQFTRNEINEKNAKIEEKKKQIAGLRQQLNDLEEQLRASGGDAGWAR
jgi:predicted RNase H-like nuclease (RuvC/YqgF family)